MPTRAQRKRMTKRMKQAKNAERTGRWKGAPSSDTMTIQQRPGKLPLITRIKPGATEEEIAIASYDF